MGWGRGGKRAGILFRASLFFHEGGEGGCNATHVEAAFSTILDPVKELFMMPPVRLSLGV